MAAPASAASGWQTFTPNGNWHCGKSKTHRGSDNVHFQVCIVRNSTHAQAVLVVLNKSNTSIWVRGETTLSHGYLTTLGACTSKTVTAGQQLGCFMPSQEHDNDSLIATGTLYFNSVGADSAHRAYWSN
ncbi:hypothetical protein D5H75_03055 [Bailinhaonella thermotolerans]|uniref:Uncharacterized protein n=2 Tax=Bailinhaonella thermotolerans TaxID=1070861 RepID=A0A3A4AZG6_9ACTN|nr:hypothetical protein D5H75_03055 [Bailinhaonella thermotolerans]